MSLDMIPRWPKCEDLQEWIKSYTKKLEELGLIVGSHDEGFACLRWGDYATWCLWSPIWIFVFIYKTKVTNIMLLIGDFWVKSLKKVISVCYLAINYMYRQYVWWLNCEVPHGLWREIFIDL